MLSLPVVRNRKPRVNRTRKLLIRIRCTTKMLFSLSYLSSKTNGAHNSLPYGRPRFPFPLFSHFYRSKVFKMRPAGMRPLMGARKEQAFSCIATLGMETERTLLFKIQHSFVLCGNQTETLEVFSDPVSAEAVANN